MSSADFSIEITRQGWLNSEPTDLNDQCSHGDLRLVIGGEAIAPGDEGDYTISTSALGLLRTLESDHSPERPVGPGTLILHCGMLILSCPVGIDWSVTHGNGRVRLHDVVRFDSTDVSEAVRFPGLEVEVEEEAYRREIVAFAESAKVPFVGVEKVLDDDDDDRKEWEDFWEEYERLLAAHADSG
jgi:hypothetical protein